jgi:hypothetical protein
MLEKESRRRGASNDVFGATSSAISDTGGTGACSPTGRSNDDDFPRVQHAVREACPSATSLQHGSFPPAADSVAAQTPRLMPVNSTSNSQLARRRRLPDICLIVVRQSPGGQVVNGNPVLETVYYAVGAYFERDSIPADGRFALRRSEEDETATRP